MIIGFAGKKYSGKTTAADYIVTNYDYKLVSFADKIKEISMDVWGLTKNQVYGTVEEKETIDKRWGISPRFIMQQLGTEVARSIHPDKWVKYVFDTAIHDLRTLGYNDFTIADVRYENEAKAIQKEGGIVVLIKRTNLKDDGDQHSSETGLPEKYIDITLENDGTLVDFCSRLAYFMNDLNNNDLMPFIEKARERRLS